MTEEDKIRRYSVHGLRFVRRPCSIPPTQETSCVVDGGTPDRADTYVPALFRDGEWTRLNRKPLKSPPKFWTELEPR